MFTKVVLLCFALKLISGLQHTKNADEEDIHCYKSSEKSIHKQFAAKTAYEEIRGTFVEPVDESCKPEKIWILSRHGAIYPTESAMTDLIALGTLRDTMFETTEMPPPLCTDDQDLLKGWIWDGNKTGHPEALSNQGWKEMETLADDYRNAYLDLFASHENVLFRHTPEQRNSESIYGFRTALFDSDDYIYDTTDSDTLFKFYEKCDKWKENNEKVNDDESVLSIFGKSTVFNQTIKGISDRLGFSTELSVDQIKNIWDMCRFDRAWVHDNSSAWCSAFTQDHIDVLEYHEDIKLYYQTGQGEEINSRLACKTVVDLINHVESDVSTTLPNVIVSVVDATTIQLLLTALGTHKDEVYRPSDDNMDNMGKRKWKSSEMSPYASNLAVIKYKCNGDGEHQVKFFLNQKKIEFEWCSNGVCVLNKFVENYQSFKDANCTEYFCSERSDSAKTELGVLAIAASLILIYF